MGADRSRQPGSWSSPCTEDVGFLAGSSPLSVVVDQLEPTAVVVSVIGELDMLTEPVLDDHLSRLLATRPQHLIIDLGGVSFSGAAGLSALIRARHAAAQQNTTLHLKGPTRQRVAWVLELAGLDCLFDIAPPAAGQDQPDSLGARRHQRVPGPRDGDHRSTGIPALSGSGSGTEHDEYAYLVPLQWHYAELAPDDPERQRLRDDLINGYAPVANHIARRFAGRGEPLEDLTQVATVGLINAVDRFEPTRGSHFLSFAIPTITGELRRYFRDHAWSTRVPRRLKDLNLAIRGMFAGLSQQLGRSPRPSEIAHQLGVPTSTVLDALHAAQAYRTSSLEEMLSCGDTTTAHSPFADEPVAPMSLIDDREALRPLLAELAPRDRTILALRFFHQLTQTQIAEQVGISQMHVSRVLRRTLDFLHERLASSD